MLAFGPQRWLLTHGDAWCLADTDYQAFRQTVRSPEWQTAFLQRPLAEREAIARQLRVHHGTVRRVLAQAGVPVTLNIVTDNTTSCARDFVIPAIKYYVLLPVTGLETVQIPPQPVGTTMRFTCSMGMYTGLIEFR